MTNYQSDQRYSLNTTTFGGGIGLTSVTDDRHQPRRNVRQCIRMAA
ncbi:MAG: hypothetical protein MZV63_32805 [Marinilabiliales bacterium]|nr:hypothetical protein [Marinilabiliales bacterium]